MIHYTPIEIGLFIKDSTTELSENSIQWRYDDAVEFLNELHSFIDTEIERLNNTKGLESAAFRVAKRILAKQGRLIYTVDMYKAYQKIITDSLNSNKLVVEIDSLVNEEEKQQIFKDLNML